MLASKSVATPASAPAAPTKPGTAVATVPGQTAKTTLRGNLKNIGAKAKLVAQHPGKFAKRFVTKNKAALIAGGALGAAGLAGSYAMGKNRNRLED